MNVNNKRKKATIVLLLMLLTALVVVFVPFQVWADNDGIPSEIEDSGACFYLPADESQTCYMTSADKADVFVILKPAENGSHPLFADYHSLEFPELFDLIDNNGPNSNEHINLHVIEFDQAPGQIIIANPPMYAVLLEENVTTTDDTAGVSDFGTPKQKLNGYVNTQRIVDEVKKVCGLQPGCIVETSLEEILSGIDTPEEIAALYIKNVAAHETFHMLGNTIKDLRKIGHHHDQLDLIMDHHVYYENDRKGDQIIWHISDAWGEWDRPFYY